jgi:hypothetical protein
MKLKSRYFGLLRFGRAGHDDRLAGDAAAIHFVIQTDDGRPAIVPGQPGMGCPALDEFVGKKWMKVVHGIDLRCRGIAPGKAERSHATLHFTEHEAGFFAKAVGAHVAEPYDALAVAGVTSCASPLPAITKDGAASFAGSV